VAHYKGWTELNLSCRNWSFRPLFWKNPELFVNMFKPSTQLSFNLPLTTCLTKPTQQTQNYLEIVFQMHRITRHTYQLRDQA